MKIMVIDGNSIINRAYHGIRPLSNHEGTPTNAVYGFLSTLFKQQDEERPDRTVVCFDVKEKTFRHLKFDTYKATRKPMDEELAVQMPIVKEVLDALGIVRCELAGYEADDLLGTISRRANENGDECVILTGDRDSLQLVGGGTVVRLVKSALGKTTYTSYTPEKFREEYGFDPIRLIDLKALMGDSSDNIPGVKGVGEKSAKQLLADFGTLDGIYEHIDDERIKKGVRAKLQADEQGARDSYWLATIDRNVPLELDVAHLPEQKIDREALYSLLTRLEFDQFIRKLGLTEGEEAAAPRLPALERCTIASAFEAFGLVDSLTEADRVFVLAGKTLGALCLLSGDTAYFLYADDMGDAWNDVLARLFDGSVNLALHDAKDIIKNLLLRGIDPRGITFDTALAAYLIDPAQSSYDLPRLALACVNEMLPALDLDDPAALSPLGGREETGRSAAQYLAAMREIFREMNDKIEQFGMRKLYYEIELPLERVLAEMENAGCAVAPDALRTFGERLETRIRDLVDQIYLDAGAEFNLNSTRQLGEILFERLGLPAPKKTKTGYSTSAEVLERLREDHPIIAHILEYRRLTKLKSTYVDGLLSVAGPEGQPHPHAFSADGHGDRPPVLDRPEPAEHSGAHRTRTRAAPHVRRAGQGSYPHRRRLFADRAARARAYLGRQAHDRRVPHGTGHSCRDRVQGLPSADRGDHERDALVLQGGQLRHRLRHFGFLARAGHRREPKGGCGLHPLVSGQLSGRGELYGNHQGDGTRAGLCNDAVRPPPCAA